MIISCDPQEVDVIVAFISSIVHPEELTHTDFLLTSDDSGFPITGLKKASVFKIKKLLTIEKSRLIRRLGRVTPDVQKELDKRLTKALGLRTV